MVCSRWDLHAPRQRKQKPSGCHRSSTLSRNKLKSPGRMCSFTTHRYNTVQPDWKWLLQMSAWCHKTLNCMPMLTFSALTIWYQLKLWQPKAKIFTFITCYINTFSHTAGRYVAWNVCLSFIHQKTVPTTREGCDLRTDRLSQ